MHFFLIFLVLAVAFPVLRPIVGSLLSVVFWLIVAAAVLAAIRAISS
jgi:hypothetical protein